jgi:hypothetical protein
MDPADKYQIEGDGYDGGYRKLKKGFHIRYVVDYTRTLDHKPKRNRSGQK